MASKGDSVRFIRKCCFVIHVCLMTGLFVSKEVGIVTDRTNASVSEENASQGWPQNSEPKIPVI